MFIISIDALYWLVPYIYRLYIREIMIHIAQSCNNNPIASSRSAYRRREYVVIDDASALYTFITNAHMHTITNLNRNSQSVHHIYLYIHTQRRTQRTLQFQHDIAQVISVNYDRVALCFARAQTNTLTI